MTGASLPPSRPEPSPRMLALKIRRDYRRQRLASGASLMPALPPALDTPQHTHSFGSVTPPDKKPPAPRSAAHKGGAVVAIARAVRRRMARSARRAAKRAPSWQDIRAVYPPTAVCGAFRIHGAHILPKPARFGCTARESCQEAPLFSSEAPFGIHGVKKLPRIAARERIRAKSCHG